MLIREYTPADLDALRRMHASQSFDYAFPDLSDPIFISKLILEDDTGRPVMAALARLTCEMYLLIDRDRADSAITANTCHSERSVPRLCLCAKRRDTQPRNLSWMSAPGSADTSLMWSAGACSRRLPTGLARECSSQRPTERFDPSLGEQQRVGQSHQGRERAPALDAAPRPPSRRRTRPPRARPRRRPRLAPSTNRQTLRPPPRIPRLAPRQHLDPLLQKIENQWLVSSG